MKRVITFGLFADFHYKKGMYSTTVEDLQEIFHRAESAGAQFMVHCGDFCNDYMGSPEIIREYLRWGESMPVYGVYGNHDLETEGNSMPYVTPRLTSDGSVIWGTYDARIGDGSVGYYYKDRNGFRLIFTDTNYSFCPGTGAWEHNPTGSYCPPRENLYGCSLGRAQLVWLERLLISSAKEGIPCIIISHHSFSGKFGSVSPDGAAVRQLFQRANAIRKGTVIMAINGHIHTNHAVMIEDVLYLDVNSVRNAWWQETIQQHYGNAHTYDYTDYDKSGNKVSSYKRKLGELSMGGCTWFTSDPLSAVVTVTQDGNVTVEGMESSWIYGIAPEGGISGTEPRILSFRKG